MNEYLEGGKLSVPAMLKKYTGKQIFMGVLYVGLLIVAFLLMLDYVFGVPIYRRKKDVFTERTAEGLRYDWNRRKLLKDDRLMAIKIMMKNYNLNPALVPKDFSNFTDFNLVKFIEESDEPDASRRAKVLLMLQPEFRKYQNIIIKASNTKSLPNGEVRKAIHMMLIASGIIMPPLETVTDVQLILAWQNTKSPIV